MSFTIFFTLRACSSIWMVEEWTSLTTLHELTDTHSFKIKMKPLRILLLLFLALVLISSRNTRKKGGCNIYFKILVPAVQEFIVTGVRPALMSLSSLFLSQVFLSTGLSHFTKNLRHIFTPSHWNKEYFNLRNIGNVGNLITIYGSMMLGLLRTKLA